MKNKNKKAVGYVRRSSHNEDSGSFDRQEKAINDFAKRNDFKIVTEGFYYDGSTSGKTSIEERDGMLALLERCKDEGIKTAIVQESGRIARQLLCQMVIIERFKAAGIDLIDCSGLMLSETDDPQRKMVIQILGAIKEMDRSETVAKMMAGRNRVRAAGGRAEGKPTFGHTEGERLIIKRIKQLRRKPAKGVVKKWVKVTRILNEEGFRNRSGGEFKSPYVSKLAKENGIK